MVFKSDMAIQLLQRAADFYTTLDSSSYGSRSSSVSDQSYRSSPDLSGTTSVIAQVKKSIPDKIEVCVSFVT